MSDNAITDVLGLFFGQYNTAVPGGDAPSQNLTLKASDLMALGSTRNIVARFTFRNPTAYPITLVNQVTLDGVDVTSFGGDNPQLSSNVTGTVDTVLLKYPNTTAALKPGVHPLVVTPGLRRSILGSAHSFGTVWPVTTYFAPRMFTITLL